jgi:hypothetical protein
MNKIILCAAALFAAAITTSFAIDKDTMLAREKAAWQAFKDKKADDFKKVVDKDIRCVYADNISNLKKELADMKKWDVK